VPPYAIINAGPKCVGLDTDKLALDYHESEACESQRTLKAELELLRDTWALFEDAADAVKHGKRKREKRSGSGSATLTVWIQPHEQPGVRDDRNTLRIMAKELSLVLLVQVQVRLDSGPQAPIPANSLHNLLTLANGKMDLGLAESP
jgi:hypothetical protein